MRCLAKSKLSYIFSVLRSAPLHTCFHYSHFCLSLSTLGWLECYTMVVIPSLPYPFPLYSLTSVHVADALTSPCPTLLIILSSCTYTSFVDFHFGLALDG